MLALDMSPQMAFDTPIVIVADAKQQSALGNRALGVCTVISNNGSEDWDTAAHGIDPIMVARLYLQTYEKYGAAVHRMPGKILSIFDPKFGALKSLPSDDGAYIYVPNEKFFGTDSVTAQVELAGRKFKVIWTLKVVDSNTGGPETRRIECGSRSLYWKISTTGDGSLDLQDNASNDPSNDTLSADTANSGFPFGPLSSNHEGVRYAGFCGATGATGATADSQYTFNNISITFAALEGQAVGNGGSKRGQGRIEFPGALKPAPTNSLRPMPACNPLPEPLLAEPSCDFDGDGKSDILWEDKRGLARFNFRIPLKPARTKACQRARG